MNYNIRKYKNWFKPLDNISRGVYFGLYIVPILFNFLSFMITLFFPLYSKVIPFHCNEPFPLIRVINNSNFSLLERIGLHLTLITIIAYFIVYIYSIVFKKDTLIAIIIIFGLQLLAKMLTISCTSLFNVLDIAVLANFILVLIFIFIKRRTKDQEYKLFYYLGRYIIVIFIHIAAMVFALLSPIYYNNSDDHFINALDILANNQISIVYKTIVTTSIFSLISVILGCIISIIRKKDMKLLMFILLAIEVSSHLLILYFNTNINVNYILLMTFIIFCTIYLLFTFIYLMFDN